MRTMLTSVLSCWSFIFFKKLFFMKTRGSFHRWSAAGFLRSASASVWQCPLGARGPVPFQTASRSSHSRRGPGHWPAHCNQCEKPRSWLSVTALRWKQPKRPSAVERRNKRWCVHTMEHPPAQRVSHLCYQHMGEPHGRDVCARRQAQKRTCRSVLFTKSTNAGEILQWCSK